MKIVLAALNAKYVHSNLAVYSLAAYAKAQMEKLQTEQEQWKDTQDGEIQPEESGIEMPEICVREYTINNNLDYILQSIYREKADVVAFSCYIWNIRKVLEVAGGLAKAAPEISIWLGGPEVSYQSEKLLRENPFLSGIMSGEGEQTFYELVKLWSREEGDGGAGLAAIAGIVYRDRQSGVRKTPSRDRIFMDDIPFIYDDLSRFANRILYYETSRGCPFSCSYCLSSIDRAVRFRSLSLVERELQFFLDHKAPQVKFIDRTFNCNREHALAIWRYILAHDNGVTNFHFEVGGDLLGEEELSLFRQMRPGLIQLEIGLQSVNPKTLKEIRRSMDIGKLKKNMLAIREFGNIHRHLDLIAGLPFEDFSSFQQSFEAAYEMKPDQLQLGFLKVLKGSYMEEKAESYRLVYQDAQPYEVISTAWISYDEILVLKQVEEMVEVYYNSGQFANTLDYLVPFFDSAFSFYRALGEYYDRERLYGIGFKREARYGALRAFAGERFLHCGSRIPEKTSDCTGFSQEEFDVRLTFDYYLRENAKSRPDWAARGRIEKEAYQAFFKNGGTEEIRLACEGYDSKAAARAMHIEKLPAELAEALRKQGAIGRGKVKGKEGCKYALFDYEHKNPLTGNALVTVLNHL